MKFLSHRHADRIRGAAIACAAAGIALSPIATQAADASTERAIEGILSGLVRPGQPGCSAGVVQDGQLAHALALGLADVERAKLLDTHSVFNLASVSKQFTAFAILLLQQQGKLSLDDPLVRYVPELALSAKGVTLRHLMHHTGGLRDYIGLLTMRQRGAADGATIHEALQALARQTRSNAEPGLEYEYSNTGYFLLGVVIARVSGQSLAGYSEEQIFDPLGMKNTRIVDRYPDGIAALARGYAKTDRGFKIDETGWEQVGDGQVHSDLHDLALWDENFYTGKLGGAALIRDMYRAGVLNSGKAIDYAAGLRVGPTRGLPSVGHGGSWVGYRSHLLRFPEERLSTIVLCNRDDADTAALATLIAQLFLKDRMASTGTDEEDDAETQPVEASWQPRDLGRYAGVYFSAEANAHCALYLANGQLVVERCAEGAVLKPGKPGEFVDQDESFALRFPDGGTGSGSFVYDRFGLRGLPFERVKEPSE
ncbi:MAG: serine hydrolase domain-containing protein [Steroidobacteraceae bacterium]